MGNRSDTIRVVIADEHDSVRQSIRRLLTFEAGFCILGEACTASAAADLTCRLKPDVLLLGLRALPEDGQQGPELKTSNIFAAPTVAMISSGDPQEVLSAFRLGARGIILKTFSRLVLLESIRSVVDGHYWFDNDSVKILVETLRELLPGDGNGRALSKNYGLTLREIHIVTKIADGRSNKEIGQEFSISERTVKHHLTSIFLKLGVSSRLELAMFAVDHDFRNNPHVSID